MELEFECGTIIKNVGELGMAMKHHLVICGSEECIADVRENIKKFGA